MMRFAAGREYPRDQTAVAGQLFGTAEAGDIADLQGNHRAKDFAHAWHGLKTPYDGIGLQDLADAILDGGDVKTNLVERF